MKVTTPPTPATTKPAAPSSASISAPVTEPAAVLPPSSGGGDAFEPSAPTLAIAETGDIAATCSRDPAAALEKLIATINSPQYRNDLGGLDIDGWVVALDAAKTMRPLPYANQSASMYTRAESFVVFHALGLSEAAKAIYDNVGGDRAKYEAAIEERFSATSPLIERLLSGEALNRAADELSSPAQVYKNVQFDDDGHPSLLFKASRFPKRDLIVRAPEISVGQLPGSLTMPVADFAFQPGSPTLATAETGIAPATCSRDPEAASEKLIATINNPQYRNASGALDVDGLVIALDAAKTMRPLPYANQSALMYTRAESFVVFHALGLSEAAKAIYDSVGGDRAKYQAAIEERFSPANPVIKEFLSGEALNRAAGELSSPAQVYKVVEFDDAGDPSYVWRTDRFGKRDIIIPAPKFSGLS